MSAAALPGTRRARLVGALLLAVLAAPACYSPSEGPERPRPRAGAVASEHPLATAVGIEVLERGGNAADAAVATALALAVVYPQAGNLGGGGFALWVPAQGEPLAFDFRETAPSSADPARYLDAEGQLVPERSIEGPLAVGVPGSPLGLRQLHQRCGSKRVSFRELVEPAIELAREGFLVDAFLARDLERPGVRERMNAAARRVFFPDGRALRTGQRLVQPELAATLEAYAARGPEAFYQGEVARAIVAELERTPLPDGAPAPEAPMSLADLAAYEVETPTPLRGWFRGYELYAMPPPSSGGLVVLQVLGMLEGLPLERARAEAPGLDPVTPLMAHWWIEAMRRAFADRAAHMGDPAFHDVPVEALLSREWIAAQRVSIGERADLDVGPWAPPPPESPQTTHLSVVDRSGNALSLTTTLNGSFGSGILVEGAGFLLNNELDDFAIQAGAPNMFGLVGSEANAIEPGKRPLSSMCPLVVRGAESELRLVLGSPGGPRIITSVLQVALRTLLLDQPLDVAVAAPRLHQQWRPTTTFFERDTELLWQPGLLAELEERGHPIELLEFGFGSVQAIAVDERGEVSAVSDPRRGGSGQVTD